jgi:hypothetical protein
MKTKNGPEPSALEAMRKSPYNFADTQWLAFENADLGSRELGHMRFLAVGPSNTIKREQVSNRLPDFPGEINWRYQLVGVVDLSTGEVQS